MISKIKESKLANNQFLKSIYHIYLNAKNIVISSQSKFILKQHAGHFYSPVPSIRDVRKRSFTIFDRTSVECPGINIRRDYQLTVLNELSFYYSNIPFLNSAKHLSERYYFDNPYYTYGDGVVLYAMLRRLQPKRVIEVGSGFSSAAMLDTDDQMHGERPAGERTAFTFIEPYPERLQSLLTAQDQDRCTVLTSRVQDVDLSVFDALEPNDILFIDSSHVLKVGSDVHHLLFHVFPRLKPGVVIHLHDVFWPFEYPEDWVMSGTAWNEAYALRAFLQYNSAFEIEYFNSYVATVHEAVLREKMPICMKDPGGAIWIRKTA